MTAFLTLSNNVRIFLRIRAVGWERRIYRGGIAGAKELSQEEGPRGLYYKTQLGGLQEQSGRSGLE